MANTTSHSYTFDKTLPIDEIVEESYERIGIINVSGYQLKTAKRSLNLLFSEWSNRGLHYWEVANQGFTLVDGTNVYVSYRSPSDGASNGLTTTLSAGINAAVTDIPLTEVKDMPGADQGGGTITLILKRLDIQENLQQPEQRILPEVFVDLMELRLLLIQVPMQSLNMRLEWIIY